MRLARAWKGLERFVNCPDSLGEFQALGKAFPDFWPMDVHYWLEESKGSLRQTSGQPSLAWHPTCHRLFLFYRDMLRELWRWQRAQSLTGAPNFLLGTDNTWHSQALESAERAGRGETYEVPCPRPLVDAWAAILEAFPNARFGSETQFKVHWPSGEFEVVPRNGFQWAFYRLFRANWRARVCPRCRLFFVARKPKQIFCGTVCSAGSRLASKLKWWREHGAERRKKSRKKRSKHAKAT